MAFILGLILGSFYNVVIYRLPKGEPFLFERSKCPKCGTPIRWYDNVPVLSFLLLRGKCRSCGQKISLQYPLVELASGLLAVTCLLKWGLTKEAFIYYAFFSALLVLSVIDLQTFLLPDSITLPGIAVGLLLSPIREDISFYESLLGAGAGFLIPFLIYTYYVKVRKMEGLGFGDVKLLAFVGSFTGIYGVLSALFLGSFVGLLAVLPILLKNKNLQFVIPFGPFLSLGCFLGVIFKERILSFLGF